ncbi:secreted protein [Melampsora americana]|nr:secreted protein [Melampsora americana]
MYQFSISIFCFATLVGSAFGEYVVCNARPGLIKYVGNTVACYTSVNGRVKEYTCDWARCNAATAKGCQINSHTWPKDVEFTCDKEYSLPVGVDTKIICEANASWEKNCEAKSDLDCPFTDENHEAECTIITNHSRCHGCTPV